MYIKYMIHDSTKRKEEWMELTCFKVLTLGSDKNTKL